MDCYDISSYPIVAEYDCGFAAEELASYLEKISGRTFATVCETDAPCIRLSVNGTPEERHARRNREAFTVGFSGADLCIVGEGPRGVIYGVYTFLEEVLGCRFFAEGCERVPKRETLEIPAELHIQKQPAFIYRDCYISCMSPACKVKNKVNASLPEDIPGGSFTYAGPFCHTLGALAEMEDRSIGRQPCLTDEKVFQTVLKNCRLLLREHPEAGVISVTQNDSAPEHRGCQCAACKAIDEREGTPAGSMIAFVNRIAEALEPEFPDVLIDTFAYRYTRKAPKTLRARHNVVVRFCTIESCFSHPIETCSRAAEDVLSDNPLAEDLRAWRDRADNLFIWDYCTNFHRYGLPFPDFRVLAPNMRFFLENHAIGVFEEGNYQSPISGELDDLRAYLLCKLLWEPDMSDEAFRAHGEEFISAFYGGAAEPMREYIETIHERTKNCHFGIYSRTPVTFGYDPKDPASVEDYKAWYASLERIFDWALAMADSEEVLLRVKRARLVLVNLRTNSPGILNDRPSEPSGQEDVFAEMIPLGVTYYREGGTIARCREILAGAKPNV